MNSVEKKLLEDDLAKAKIELADQVRKPKAERNDRELKNSQNKVNTLRKWLKD